MLAYRELWPVRNSIHQLRLVAESASTPVGSQEAVGAMITNFLSQSIMYLRPGLKVFSEACTKHTPIQSALRLWHVVVTVSFLLRIIWNPI